MIIDLEKEKRETERLLQETINYLREILEDIIKLTQKIDKINKDWIGIDRSSEMLIHRVKNPLSSIQLLIESVFFNLSKKENFNSDIKDSITDLYQKAIEKWGKKVQTLMVIEEMSELSVNLCHLLRGRIKTTDIKQLDLIAEEIADVEITLEQLKIMYNLGLIVYNIKQCKLERLKYKLESECSG